MTLQKTGTEIVEHDSLVIGDRLELVQLSENSWQVSDLHLAESIGIGVVGYIERVVGVYEAIDIADPASPAFFASLSDAVEAFLG